MLPVASIFCFRLVDPKYLGMILRWNSLSFDTFKTRKYRDIGRLEPNYVRLEFRRLRAVGIFSPYVVRTFQNIA